MTRRTRFLMFVAGLGFLIVGTLLTSSPQLPDWHSATPASYDIVRSALNKGLNDVDAQLRSQHLTKRAADFRIIGIILGRRG